MFRKMLSSLGIDAPGVDTRLADPIAEPGGLLRGDILVEGGGADVDIDYITLSLVTGVADGPHTGTREPSAEFHRAKVQGTFTLPAKSQRTIPFELRIPWETPITEVEGQRLSGATMGVRTELAVAKSADRGDLDPLAIAPLPSQLRVLSAFDRLGFQFAEARLERGQLPGARQTLPFFQEIAFYPPQQAAGVGEVRVAMVTAAAGLDVVVDTGSRGGFRNSGPGGASHRWSTSHDAAADQDWEGEIGAWLDRAAAQAQSSWQQQGFGMGDGDRFGRQGFGRPEHGHRGYEGRRSGPGWGGVAAGAGAGLLGGLLAGEVMDEMFGDEE